MAVVRAGWAVHMRAHTRHAGSGSHELLTVSITHAEARRREPVVVLLESSDCC